MNKFVFIAIGFVVVLLLSGPTESSRFVFPIFDLHGNGIFGGDLHLESRDPLLPVDVTVSMATGTVAAVTLQPNGTGRIRVIPPPSVTSTAPLNTGRTGIEVSSNGSLIVYAILSHDVRLSLFPTTEVGCEYRVVSLSDPSNDDNKNNNRILRPIELFLVSTEDNTTVVLQPRNGTTLATMNNLETYSVKTEIRSEGLWIRASKPVSVFVLQKIHETGKNTDRNETATITTSNSLTVMQLMPLKFWSTRYTIRCSNCEDMNVHVSIFAASSSKATKVRVKDKASDRVLTISRFHQTTRAILALDKSPTTVDAEDRIQLLIHEGVTDGRTYDHKDGNLELTIDDPARVLIPVCSSVGTESLLCAVDYRRSVEFDFKGTRMDGSEIGDKWAVKYGHNYGILRGAQPADIVSVSFGETTATAAAFGQSVALGNGPDASKMNPRQPDASSTRPDLAGFYRGRVAVGLGLGSGLSGEENETRPMEEEDPTAVVGKRNQAFETVEIEANQTRSGGGGGGEWGSPSTAKIDREKTGSPSTKSTKPLQFHKNSSRRPLNSNSKSPPNANFAPNKDDASIGGTDGKSLKEAPPDDGISVNGINASAITKSVTRISQTFVYKPHKDEIELTDFGRHPRNTSRPTNVSDTDRYNPINPKGKDQHNRPMHKTLNMFVMKKDVIDKAGHRVVNYFEIGAEEVERSRVGVSPTVIAVITSLCGAVFFVVACILGFVITEVFCTKGRIQRSKISPFVELTNSWY